MTMTMRDIRRHEHKEFDCSPYSPRKSKAAFDLSLRERVDRATIIEKFIAQKIEDMTGYRTEITTPNCHWDITFHHTFKIEVKSAMIKKRGGYAFQNIKPSLFDYLFIVFVTPTGTVEKWAFSEDVEKFCKKRTRGCNGFSINTTPDKIPHFFYDFEDFPFGD